MSKQEWSEQFNALNGRYPTPEELQMGLDQGLYLPDEAPQAAPIQDLPVEAAQVADQGVSQAELTQTEAPQAAPIQAEQTQAAGQTAPAQANQAAPVMTAQAWMQQFEALNGRPATQEEYQLAYSQGYFQLPKAKKPFNAKLFYQIFNSLAIAILVIVALYQGFSFDSDEPNPRTSYLSTYLHFLQIAVLVVFWNALNFYRGKGLSQAYDEVTTDFLTKSKQHWLSLTGLILGLVYLFAQMIYAFANSTVESVTYDSKFFQFFNTLFVGQEGLTLAVAVFALVMMALLSPRWEQARIAKAQLPKTAKLAFLKRIDLKWSLGLVAAVVVLFVLIANIYNAATLSGQWEMTNKDYPDIVTDDSYLTISGKEITGYVVDDDYEESDDDDYDYSSYLHYEYVYGDMDRDSHRIHQKSVSDDDDDRTSKKITYTKVGGRLKIKVGNDFTGTFTKKRDLFHLF